MSDIQNIKRVCSFSVSNWHLVTMLTPYLNEAINQNEEIYTFFETNMEIIIREFLMKLTLNVDSKQKLYELNWKNSKGYKYSYIETVLKDMPDKDITIIVAGQKEYIDKINEKLLKFIKRNKIKNRIKIVSCFEVMQFNNNISEILKNNDKVLNTSGEKDIAEVFDGYADKKEIC